jgi:hypothetical protein
MPSGHLKLSLIVVRQPIGWLAFPKRRMETRRVFGRGLAQRARAELGKEEQENRRTGEQERRCRRCSPTGELPVILSTLEKDTLVFVSPQSAMSITGPTAVPGD